MRDQWKVRQFESSEQIRPQGQKLGEDGAPLIHEPLCLRILVHHLRDTSDQPVQSREQKLRDGRLVRLSVAERPTYYLLLRTARGDFRVIDPAGLPLTGAIRTRRQAFC
jgi:hypothetical protein